MHLFVSRKHSACCVDTGAWSTIGVLATKKTFETKDGRPYSRWELSDLNQTQVKVFLWGKAHTHFWKESEGSVIILYNAATRQVDGRVSLNVNVPEQVQVLGTSRDFGLCGATKKVKCNRFLHNNSMRTSHHLQ